MNLDHFHSLRAAGEHDRACELIVQWAAQAPADADLQYEAACVHDFLGREADAVAYYVAALALPLSREKLRSAYLGLGSTYRTLGRYASAEQTLLKGLSLFPEANELKVFLAMVRHNLGQSKPAVESLLALLAETSSDKAIQDYRDAIAFYAQDIDKSWP